MEQEAGKPPEAIRRRLEVVSDQAMPGFERMLLGEWALRASIGATSRANTVWPGGEPGVSLPTAIATAERWYQERNLRCGFQVFEPTGDALISALRDKSYEEVDGALVLWAPVHRISLRPVATVGVTLVTTPTIDPRLAQLVDDPDRVREITMEDPEPSFVAASGDNGEILGGGKSVLLEDSLGIFAMLTAPSARRRGIATQVLNHLISAGVKNGAEWVWLQVAASNHAAISLYEQAGFERGHSYVYMFGSKS